MLNLAEELLLLSLNDSTGKVRGSVSSYLQYGLAGALIADLALRGRVAVGEKKRLTLLEGPLTGDPLLDAVIEQLRDSTRERKAAGWVQRLGRGKLTRGVAERLVELGVLGREQKFALGLFPYPVYPQLGADDPPTMLKTQLRARVRPAGPERRQAPGQLRARAEQRPMRPGRSWKRCRLPCRSS